MESVARGDEAMGETRSRCLRGIFVVSVVNAVRGIGLGGSDETIDKIAFLGYYIISIQPTPSGGRRRKNWLT